MLGAVGLPELAPCGHASTGCPLGEHLAGQYKNKKNGSSWLVLLRRWVEMQAKALPVFYRKPKSFQGLAASIVSQSEKPTWLLNARQEAEVRKEA